jgi:hypothetical protein
MLLDGTMHQNLYVLVMPDAVSPVCTEPLEVGTLHWIGHNAPQRP